MTDTVETPAGDDEDYTWDDTDAAARRTFYGLYGLEEKSAENSQATIPPGGRPLSDWGLRVDLRTVDQRVDDEVAALHRRLAALEATVAELARVLEVRVIVEARKVQP